jgi:P4 family phage/plasmid primase-like protien
MRRRLHLVPFTVTIPHDERDPDLAEKLKAEWPGILKWMIEGCLKWRATGLRPPKAVLEATAQYLAEQDSIGQWLAETCDLSRAAETKSSTLYAAWKAWAEAAGEKPGTQKTFSQSLEEREFKIKHTRDGNFIAGLKMRML